MIKILYTDLENLYEVYKDDYLTKEDNWTCIPFLVPNHNVIYWSVMIFSIILMISIG